VEYFQDLSEKLAVFIGKRDNESINYTLFKTLQILNEWNEDFVLSLERLAQAVPQFIVQMKKILDYPMTRRMLDLMIAMCFYLHTLDEVELLFKSTVLNKIMRGEEPWRILTTLKQPSTSSNFLKILSNWLPFDEEQKTENEFVCRKHAFAKKLRASGILPFLIRAKFCHVFVIDIYYLSIDLEYANKETMKTVLTAMWHWEWYGGHGKEISYGEKGNCLVDDYKCESHVESEKEPRYLRRAWILFWSRKELTDFGRRFKSKRAAFFHMVRDFVIHIVGTDQMAQDALSLSEAADDILHGINADWLRDHRTPNNLYYRLVNVRDHLHKRLEVTKGEVDAAVLKTRSIEVKDLETELLRQRDKEYIKVFDHIRKQYFGMRCKPDTEEAVEKTIKSIHEKVKRLRSKLERKVTEQVIDSAKIQLADMLDTAVQWQTHLEVNYGKIIDRNRYSDHKGSEIRFKTDKIRFYFLEFDPKDTNDALCFNEEKKALCDIFENKNVEFTSTNFSWHPFMSAWTDADILYISGHSYQQFKDYFDFESEWSGEHVYRSEKRVRDGFKILPIRDPPKLVVLSQCRSEQFGEWFQKAGVPFVVVSKRNFLLNDQDAYNFLRGFFQKLVENKTIPEAFRYGQNFVMGKTKRQEGCCCMSHDHSCVRCRKHRRWSCCRGTYCQRKTKIQGGCPCAPGMLRATCCEPTCTLDPKDRFKILDSGNISSISFDFKNGNLRELPEPNRLHNIQRLEKIFQRHKVGKCAVGEILVLLRKGNKVVVVHSEGEPGLGKKQTCLAVCHHLLRNYLDPNKPPWKHGIWQIEQSQIEWYLNKKNDEKVPEVAKNGVKQGFKFLEWLWKIHSYESKVIWDECYGNSGNSILQKWQSQGDVLFLLFAPNDEKLLRELFLQLNAVQEFLPDYMQFIVTCREPPKDLDLSFETVALEPLSYRDGTRLFKQILRKKNKWRHFCPPPVIKFHNGHSRDRLMYNPVVKFNDGHSRDHRIYNPSHCCDRSSWRRLFLCARCNLRSCESCWANWELTYLFVDSFNALRDVPLSDSNLPDFDIGIREKCAKSQEEYREILTIVENVQFQSRPQQHAIQKFPEKLKREIMKWYNAVEKRKLRNEQLWYNLACCPSNSFEARSRKGNLWNHCLKCREIKYYIHCRECNKDLCEHCWIQKNFHKGNIPYALANRNRLWSWKTLNPAWSNECVKYFTCLFLRGNPSLIWQTADLLGTEVGEFKCTINILIELVYTFIHIVETEPAKIESYLRGNEMAWVTQRGSFPKKLSKECSENTSGKLIRFLKLLHKVQLPSNMKGRRYLRQLNGIGL